MGGPAPNLPGVRWETEVENVDSRSSLARMQNMCSTWMKTVSNVKIATTKNTRFQDVRPCSLVKIVNMEQDRQHIEKFLCTL
jgi:hypothetical protein